MSNIGRNDPCPCGSGKKYKKCCLPIHEATRAADLGRVDELGAALDQPEECWVCGKPANRFSVTGFGHEDAPPDSITLNVGPRKLVVHGSCMAEAERRLTPKPGDQTPAAASFGEWTWCVYCERTHRTDRWVANDGRCPGGDCEGTLGTAHAFQDHQGWPTTSYLSGADPYRFVYLENPTDGGYYPLHPQWNDEDELLKIGTRGRWSGRTWVPAHPIEHRRVELPDGSWVEGNVQLRQCQVCGHERLCTLGGCWDCRKIVCVECEDGFGKCKECSER